MGEYAGESIAKKVARVRLYTRAKQVLLSRLESLRGIRALILPGPHASEVGALRHILGVEQENIVAIDRDADACDAMRIKCPRATVVCGELVDRNTLQHVLDALTRQREPRMFGFMHLDMMGTLSVDTINTYCKYAPLCEVNGVIASTYARGRDGIGRTPSEKFGPQLRNYISQTKLYARQWVHDFRRTREGRLLIRLLSPDPIRSLEHWNGTTSGFFQGMAWIRGVHFPDHDGRCGVFADEAEMKWVREIAASSGVPTPVGCYAYKGKANPMGVLVMQRLLSSYIESDSFASIRYQRSRHAFSVIKKDSMLDMLREVDSLSKTYDRTQIAEILDVSTGTLAAWLAHRTMGTYVEK